MQSYFLNKYCYKHAIASNIFSKSLISNILLTSIIGQKPSVNFLDNFGVLIIKADVYTCNILLDSINDVKYRLTG